MRDLGDAVITWDTPIGRADCRRIFAAAAAMHASFAGRAPDGLCPLEGRLSVFAPRMLRGVPAAEYPLVGAALAGWERFAELAPSAVAAAVAAIHDDLLDDIRAAQGSLYDETALRLALLAAVADLGWNKALDAAGSDVAVRRRETAELDWWCTQARQALELGVF